MKIFIFKYWIINETKLPLRRIYAKVIYNLKIEEISSIFGTFAKKYRHT